MQSEEARAKVDSDRRGSGGHREDAVGDRGTDNTFGATLISFDDRNSGGLMAVAVLVRRVGFVLCSRRAPFL